MSLSIDGESPLRAFLARALISGLLVLLMPVQAHAAPAPDDIVIVAVEGDVRVTSAGAEHGARAGETLDLPAAVNTGRDGSIDLRQGDTTIGVGPDTQLSFPAPAAGHAAIDRVVQPAGNAYYNVGPRGKNRLRVETPYLVAVIKGTQFNVAVAADSSTITLHEGQLEVLATDDGVAAVLLNAGEVAIRKRGEKTIRVLQVRAGRTPAAPLTADQDDESEVTALLPSGRDDSGPELPGDGSPLANDVEELLDTGVTETPAGTVDIGVAIGVDGGIAGLGNSPIGIDTGLSAGVDLGAGTIEATVDAGIDLGAVGVDTGADIGVDLGAGTIDASVDAGVAGADVGVDLGVDLTGGDAGLNVGIDLLGTDLGLDLGLGGGAPENGGAGAPDTDRSGGLLGGILRHPRN